MSEWTESRTCKRCTGTFSLRDYGDKFTYLVQKLESREVDYAACADLITCPACNSKDAKQKQQETRKQKMLSNFVLLLLFGAICGLIWLADHFGFMPVVGFIFFVTIMLNAIVSSDDAARIFGALNPYLIVLGAIVTVVLMFIPSVSAKVRLASLGITIGLFVVGMWVSHKNRNYDYFSNLVIDASTFRDGNCPKCGLYIDRPLRNCPECGQQF